jgi:hypothetical protein
MARIAGPSLSFEATAGSVSVPLPGDLVPSDIVEIRVASPDGRREIRERFPVEPGVKSLEMKLPADWLTPGIYYVERRVIDRDSSVERTSDFRVVIP